MHSKGQGITIRSFFHLANQAGIPLAPFSKEHLSILPNIQNGKTGKWIKSEEELPVFPECHHVLMVAEDRKRLSRQRTRRYVEYAGQQLAAIASTASFS